MANSNSFFNADLLVLSILKVEDCYGYELVKKIKEISDGAMEIKEGTLYPVVHTLLKKGYISGNEKLVNKKVRVYYHLEPTGLEYLEETVKNFKRSIKGVIKIVEYGEGIKSE